MNEQTNDQKRVKWRQEKHGDGDHQGLHTFWSSSSSFSVSVSISSRSSSSSSSSSSKVSSHIIASQSIVLELSSCRCCCCCCCWLLVASDDGDCARRSSSSSFCCSCCFAASFSSSGRDEQLTGEREEWRQRGSLLRPLSSLGRAFLTISWSVSESVEVWPASSLLSLLLLAGTVLVSLDDDEGDDEHDDEDSVVVDELAGDEGRVWLETESGSWSTIVCCFGGICICTCCVEGSRCCCSCWGWGWGWVAGIVVNWRIIAVRKRWRAIGSMPLATAAPLPLLLPLANCMHSCRHSE